MNLNIILNYFSYFQYDTVSSIRVYKEYSSQFPNIYLCDIDFLTKNETLDYFLNTNNSSWKYQLNNDPNYLGIYSDTTLDAMIRISQFIVKNSNNLNETVKNSFQNPINETFLSCLYNFEKCHINDFSIVQNLLGLCIKIDIKNKISKPGDVNGLSLDILLDPPNERNHFIPMRGIKVLISNESVIPDSNLNGINISPGKRTNIQVK